MNSQNSNSALDKKGVLKAMGFAIFVALLGIGILGWQYHQIEKKRIPLLEERIEKQKEEMEQKSAEYLLDKFMLARIEKNEVRAMSYLTEGSMEQKLQAEFDLINNFKSYEILKKERIAENKFRYIVKISEEGGIGYIVEAIILTKILEQYYVDSVELVG